jgi:hypothetical protein
MYTVIAIKGNEQAESFHLEEHNAKHQAIDLAYEGYQSYIYFGDKHIGYRKEYRTEQFGNCFAVVRV